MRLAEGDPSEVQGPPELGEGPAGGSAPGLSTGLKTTVAVLLVVGVAARFVTSSHLWLDEALSVNIARLPLGEIPGALRNDGAPPLYYVLLHFWTALVGTSALAVRALSGVFAVAAIPLAWQAGRRVGGERVGLAAVILMATNPFAVRYATEARMYSLMTVLVLGGYLAAVRVLEGGGRRPCAVLGVATGLALLTHYWSLYLVAVGLGLLAVRSLRATSAGRRAAARRALGSMAAGCLLLVPWVPTFGHQLAHTGTPWGRPGTLRSFFDTVFDFAGGYGDPGLVLGLLFFGLLVLALFAQPFRGRQVVVGVRPRQPVTGLTLLVAGTVAVAIVAGQVGGSAFAVRYASVVFPLFVLVLALGTSVLRDRQVYGGVLALAVGLGLWAMWPNAVRERTSAGLVASALAGSVQPGDVVAYCPDQLGPAVSRLLPEGVDQVTYPRGAPPQLVDWSDYESVNQAADPADFARLLLARAGPAHDIWVVWANGYRTFGLSCQDLLTNLEVFRPQPTDVVVAPRYFERPGLVRFQP